MFPENNGIAAQVAELRAHRFENLFGG